MFSSGLRSRPSAGRWSGLALIGARSRSVDGTLALRLFGLATPKSNKKKEGEEEDEDEDEDEEESRAGKGRQGIARHGKARQG